jgi:hypothetical protein
MRGAVVVLVLGNVASALSVAAILLERFLPAYEEGRLTRLGWACVIAYASLVGLCGAAAIFFGFRVRRRLDGPGGERPRKFTEIGMGIAVATLLMAMWPFGWLVHRKLSAPVPQRWELDVPTAVRFWRGLSGPKRWEFTRALAFEGHAEGFAEFLTGAESPDRDVRREAAEQFLTIVLQGRRFPDPDGAASALHRLILDRDGATGQTAIHAAEWAVRRRWLRHAAIADPLVTAVESARPANDDTGDISPELVRQRTVLMEALAWLGPGGSVRSRIEALRADPDCDDDLRQRCAKLLEELETHGEGPFREEFSEGR